MGEKVLSLELYGDDELIIYEKSNMDIEYAYGICVAINAMVDNAKYIKLKYENYEDIILLGYDNNFNEKMRDIIYFKNISNVASIINFKPEIGYYGWWIQASLNYNLYKFKDRTFIDGFISFSKFAIVDFRKYVIGLPFYTDENNDYVEYEIEGYDIESIFQVYSPLVPPVPYFGGANVLQDNSGIVYI